MMRLFCSATSPYARKVRVALRELGLADQVEEVLVDPHDAPAELLAANPLSKIPTLITDRGEALPDSSLILEYLQSRKKGLTPLPGGTRRWAALRMQRVAEGIIDAAYAMVMEKRRPESIVYTPFLDRQAAAIRRACDLLNLEAGALSAETVSAVEITAGVALAYLDFRLPYLEWRKERPALAEWHARFCERPSMQDTAPPPA